MKISFETSKRVITVTPTAGKDIDEVFILPTIAYTRDSLRRGLKTCDVIFGFAIWHIVLAFTVQAKED